MSHFIEKAREGRDSSQSSLSSAAGFRPLLDHDGEEEIWNAPSRRKSRITILSWVGQLLLFACSVAFFWSGAGRRDLTDNECAAQVSAYSPAMDSLEFADIRFQGAVLDTNPWKGPPSPELDDAWDMIVNKDFIRVSEEEMRTIKKPSTQVKFPDEAGGGYAGGLEIFHQLHCLNTLRISTHADYYRNLPDPPPQFSLSNTTQRLHLDHCVDILRQSLMCHGDAGLVTSSWVEGHSTPYPDFSTWHKCRSLVPLVQYTRKHRVEAEVRRTADSVVLDKPPCERAYNDWEGEGEAPEVCP